MDAAKPNATYAYTTLKKLLADTKFMCRIDNTTSEDIYIIPCILECAKEMLTQLDFQEKVVTLPIANLIAKLPDDFVKFDKPRPIIFTTNGAVDYSQYYSNFSVIYNGEAFLTASPFQSTFAMNIGLPRVQVQGGQLLFSNNITATECTISYLGCNIDEDGSMRIPLINSRPIAHGAAWLYKANKGDPQSSYIHHQLIYVNGKGDRRGAANIPDSLMSQRLAYIFNSLNYENF